MNKRVTVAKRTESQQQVFGGSGNGTTLYKILGTFWAAEDFNRGVKSLREGAYDAYDTVMFRMRYNAQIDEWCLIQYQGKWYQIQSFNAGYQENQIQITAVKMANQTVNILKEFTPVDFTLPIHVNELYGKSIVANFDFTEADIINYLKLVSLEEQHDVSVVKDNGILMLSDGSDIFNPLTIVGRTIAFGPVSGGPTITKIKYTG